MNLINVIFKNWIKDTASTSVPRMQPGTAKTAAGDWVITGGFNWDIGLEEMSNEIYSGGSFLPFAPDLPRPAFRHALVALRGGSNLFMVGGNIASDEMHIYSGSSWSTEATKLPEERANVAAGLGKGDQV